MLRAAASPARWPIVAVVVTVMSLGIASSACAEDRHVSPGGTDSGDCRSSACATLEYAYGLSAEGDVIRVGAGTYGPQVVPNGVKRVTVQGASGNKVRKLDNHASNITFDGIDVDAGMTKPNGAAFENHVGPG